MVHKSTPVSAKNPININHRKISLTGTDHFEKKQSLFLNTLENV